MRLGFFRSVVVWTAVLGLLFLAQDGVSADAPGEKAGAKAQGPEPVPVRVAPVAERTVSSQVSLIGTTEAIAVSTIASESAGVVEHFPVRAGQFVEKGTLLVRLKDTETRLRLKSYMAERERVRANLENAEKELERVSKLRAANSISQTAYDGAYYTHQALSKAFLRSQAEIDLLDHTLSQKEVFAPFTGFVAEEHTQVGEWIVAGGPVVTLIDLSQVLVQVDVPERYAVQIDAHSAVRARIVNLPDESRPAGIYTIFPQASVSARTLPIRVRLDNPDFRIHAGMEAQVDFSLAETRTVLLVPKDAVVTSGNDRTVFAVVDGRAMAVGVRITGYHDGDVAVEGDLEPGLSVVIRGNERLRPGQPVAAIP